MNKGGISQGCWPTLAWLWSLKENHQAPLPVHVASPFFDFETEPYSMSSRFPFSDATWGFGTVFPPPTAPGYLHGVEQVQGLKRTGPGVWGKNDIQQGAERWVALWRQERCCFRIVISLSGRAIAFSVQAPNGFLLILQD